MPQNLFLDYLMPEIPRKWSKMVLLLDVSPDTPEYKKCPSRIDECIPGGERHMMAIFVEYGNTEFKFFESNSAANAGMNYFENKLF
jgi:hypothetical protein